MMSSTSTSGRSDCALASASSPSWATSTSNPLRCRNGASSAVIGCSSSTKRTRDIFAWPIPVGVFDPPPPRPSRERCGHRKQWSPGVSTGGTSDRNMAAIVGDSNRMRRGSGCYSHATSRCNGGTVETRRSRAPPASRPSVSSHRWGTKRWLRTSTSWAEQKASIGFLRGRRWPCWAATACRPTTRLSQPTWCTS